VPVDLLILPRPDLSPAGYRRLGRALWSWLEPVKVEQIDADGLADLAGGKPPRKVSSRYFRSSAVAVRRCVSRTERPLRFRLATSIDAVVLIDPDGGPVRYCPGGMTPAERKRILASLHRCVPAELVEAVRRSGPD
jgi:hypothetical protein